jgi:hypothetical protein
VDLCNEWARSPPELSGKLGTAGNSATGPRGHGAAAAPITAPIFSGEKVGWAASRLRLSDFRSGGWNATRLDMVCPLSNGLIMFMTVSFQTVYSFERNICPVFAMDCVSCWSLDGIPFLCYAVMHIHKDKSGHRDPSIPYTVMCSLANGGFAYMYILLQVSH